MEAPRIVVGYLLHPDDVDALAKKYPATNESAFAFGMPFRPTLNGLSIWKSPHAKPGDPIRVYAGEPHEEAIARHFTPTPTEPSQ